MDTTGQRVGRALALAGIGWAAREAVHRLRAEDLSGHVAVVTGGSRGFGFLIARELARAGCRVVIAARDAAELERARQALAQDGAEVLTVVCDVADREQAERLVDAARARFGRVDILVANAGIIQVGPVESMTPADFEQAVGIMYWGVVYPALAVLPEMRERRHGHIVNVTSIGGLVSVPRLLPYNSAKFAAVGFSEGLAAEMDKDGVRVTTVIPGLMRTGSYLNAQFTGRQEIEFGWFSLGSTLPLISMDAERAARRVVRAIQRGEREVITTLPANVLARFHGLFPGATVALLSLANRLLPSTGAGTAQRRGKDVQATLSPAARTPLRVATALGRSAARRFNQIGPADPPV